MNNSLTIILQINHLSGEFKNLIYQSLKLHPKFLIINTTNSTVIDYCMTHYRKYSLTCYRFIDLKKLIKDISSSERQTFPLYKTDHYLAFNTVDPIITSSYIKSLLEEYIKINTKYGYTANPITYQNLILPNEMNVLPQTEPIFSINDKILFCNSNISHDSYHYVITPDKLDYLPQLKLVNKTILITGALGGIGFAIAQYYKNLGWSVIGIDLIKKDLLSSNQKKIFNHYYDINLSSRQSYIHHKLKHVLRHIKFLNLLVHTAGLQISGPIEESTSSQWDQIMSVNLKSIYFIMQQCLPLLKQTLGNIIIIGSIHSSASSVNIAMYAISKAAVIGLVRNAAIEFSRFGIRVNGIAPGAIDTKMLRDGITRRGEPLEQAMKTITDRHLMHRIGQPNDIAELVSYLGDNDKSGFLLGQTIIIDGGASLVLSTEVNNNS